MRVPPLRDSCAMGRTVGQRVAVQNGDFVELGRDRLRRGEASLSRADDNGVIGDRSRHWRLSPAFVRV